jgi:phytanoyl-CoA hydroxylase
MTNERHPTRLSEAQRSHYHEHGFVLIPNLIEASSLESYEARFVEFASGRIPPVADMKIMRDIMVVKGAVAPETPMHAINKMINFEEDPALYGYTREPGILECVRDLIGDDVFSISTNVFNKPPGVDGRHPMHQDLRYFRIRPADGIVGTWTALGRANRDSGCLAVLPGSHRGELLDHGDPDWDFVNAGFFAVDVDAEAREYVEMQRGDTLFFHPLLIHGSGQNRSSTFRRAISSHYAAGTCESPVREWRVGKSVRHIPLGDHRPE